MADMSAQYRQILNDEYTRRKSKNPRYTQSAFARSLGVDKTYWSKLRSGKIILSLDIAEKLTTQLKLDQKARAAFLLSAADEQRCHALYLIDPSLTDCDPDQHAENRAPAPRRSSETSTEVGRPFGD